MEPNKSISDRLIEEVGALAEMFKIEYDSYIRVGFSKEQAFDMVKIHAKKVLGGGVK